MLNEKTSTPSETALIKLDRDFRGDVIAILNATSYCLGFENIGNRKYVNVKPVQYLDKEVGNITITEDNVDLLVTVRDELKNISRLAVSFYLLELFIRRANNVPLTSEAIKSLQGGGNVPVEKISELIALFPNN